MTQISFDKLAYATELESAGFMRQQAEVQAKIFHAFAVDQDARVKQELATRADLQAEIRALELRLLKWQFGIAVALAAIMAKGFGWLGF